MEWKNDAELFELLRKQLYTAIVGDVLDVLASAGSFFPLSAGPPPGHGGGGPRHDRSGSRRCRRAGATLRPDV